MKLPRTDLAKPEHIAAAVSRAEEMLRRASLVNKAQYAHGINATAHRIEHYLKGVKEGTKGDYGGLNILKGLVMELGGYLYALEKGL